MPAHPPKSSPLFDQWLAGWCADTLAAVQAAGFSIGTDASFEGNGIGTAAFMVHCHHTLFHQLVRPCSANLSFDGELHALRNAIDFISLSPNNEAAIKAAINNSPHSGFPISLAICKALDKWFHATLGNMLQIRWFPGHMGLELNELTDAAAGSSFPRVNPKPCITTSSRHRLFQSQAVTDWHAQSLPLIDQQHICLKSKCK